MNGQEKKTDLAAGTEELLKVLSRGRTVRAMLQAEKHWRSKGRKSGRVENLGQAWWYSNHTKSNQEKKGKERGGA